MHDSVTVHMAAPPERVFDLVSDVTRIGRYSPETFEAEWLDGATGPAVGAKFRGHVKRNGWGPVYWTTCTVLECEPGREFAFGVGKPEQPLNVWRYHLEPADGGTDVTESFRLADTASLRLYWKVLGWARGKTNRNDMRTTLERVKADAEGSTDQTPS
ncbi:MAG TPA: SRPBCC family protein [Acidimicrobiales bacterium]|nr:SRPBCC family protein [Acidimicrobiales bacterium]